MLALATLLVTFSQSTLESIFAIWAMDRYHVGPLTVGMTLFVLAIVAVSVQGGLVRKLAPRFGEHRLALGGIVCYVFGLATVAYGGGLPLVIVGLVFCGLGGGLFSPSGAALASHQAQTHNRGAVMGVYQSGTSSARVIAPFVAGPVYMRFGPASPYLLACVVTLQALWCILAARRLHAAESSHAGA
jgi:DHA1 family tetracycline resistance protein-like MFS transporter